MTLSAIYLQYNPKFGLVTYQKPTDGQEGKDFFSEKNRQGKIVYISSKQNRDGFLDDFDATDYGVFTRELNKNRAELSSQTQQRIKQHWQEYIYNLTDKSR